MIVKRLAVVVGDRAGPHRAGGNGRRLRRRGAVTVPSVIVNVSLASIAASPCNVDADRLRLPGRAGEDQRTASADREVARRWP